jgi:predicted nucleic acid-binding protein
MAYLIDSNILIYHLGGKPEAVEFVREHFEESFVSLVSYYEVLNYPMEPGKEKGVRKFLEIFPLLSVDREIVEQALENRKRRRIKMADNFIAGTAQCYGLKVVTRNGKDFSGLIATIDPFREGV